MLKFPSALGFGPGYYGGYYPYGYYYPYRYYYRPYLGYSYYRPHCGTADTDIITATTAITDTKVT